MKKLICAVTILAVSTAQANTIYVDDDSCPRPGNGSASGTRSGCSTMKCAWLRRRHHTPLSGARGSEKTVDFTTHML